MSTIQKQLDNKNGTKKSIFHFGKKKPETSKNPHLTEQLKELSQTLQEINTNLSDQSAHVADSNKPLNKSKPGRVRTDINLNRSVDSEDFPIFKDLHVRRSNSLKSSVQRLAQRTFGKAGWRRHRKSDVFKPDEMDRYFSEHSEEMQDYIDLTSSSTADEQGQLSLDLSSGDVSSVDEGRSLPQSPCSLPEERMTSLCHSLVRSNSGPVVNGFTDGSSVGSDTEMSSPRREVNPLVMAQIEVSWLIVDTENFFNFIM